MTGLGPWNYCVVTGNLPRFLWYPNLNNGICPTIKHESLLKAIKQQVVTVETGPYLPMSTAQFSFSNLIDKSLLHLSEMKIIVINSDDRDVQTLSSSRWCNQTLIRATASFIPGKSVMHLYKWWRCRSRNMSDNTDAL